MVSPLPSPQKPRRRRRSGLQWSDLLTLVVLFGLMSAVYLLPPDTSLAQVEQRGTLNVCIPDAYPPLVLDGGTGGGFDIDLLQAVAAQMHLRLAFNQNPSIGKDFNPRNWRVNRAQCEVVAGGVVTTGTTRSFLETVETGLQTGWAAVVKPGATLHPGATVGIYPGLGGLDRLALSSFLRAQKLRAAARPSIAALQQGLEQGTYEIAIAESLSLRQILVAHPDWNIAWMPATLGRFSLGFGLWKGDLTLKRALLAALTSLEASGEIATLQQRYGIIPITDELAVAN